MLDPVIVKSFSFFKDSPSVLFSTIDVPTFFLKRQQVAAASLEIRAFLEPFSCLIACDDISYDFVSPFFSSASQAKYLAFQSWKLLFRREAIKQKKTRTCSLASAFLSSRKEWQVYSGPSWKET